MNGLLRPCLHCGELTRRESRCEGCETAHNTARHRGIPKSAAQREKDRQKYDSAWKRLSRRARQRQGYCSDCGARDDLTCDHTAAAWKRMREGKPLRLCDVDVVCRSCNAKRGHPEEEAA